MRFWPAVFASLLFSFAASAQEGQLPAQDFLRAHANDLGVAASDLAELPVLDRYPSPGGIEHVYLGQSYNGTPIYNAGATVHFRGTEVLHHTSRLAAGIAGRIENTVPALTLQQAFISASPPPGAILEEGELVYYPLPETGTLRLCWQLTIDDRAAGIHSLSMVDAVTALEHYRADLSVSCSFPEVGRRSAGKKAVVQPEGTPLLPLQDGAMYYVYPFGLESPLDGDRQLMFEPADRQASPFGWHDTDGIAGPEYTITRGNNAYAYRDADGQRNEPDTGYVANGEAALDFDFPLDPHRRPEAMVQASLTQLFYNANALHDWAFAHGFDERAGNFQQFNYGGGGRAGDPVLAEAQDASGNNNATFYTPRDGKPGRMQMFLWRGRTELFEVRYPAALAGRYPSANADFGPQLGDDPVAGELAIGLDGSDQPTLGCGPLVNGNHLKGKVVLLQRGECAFQLKAYRAEQAGARAVIISNPENDLFPMGAMEAGEDYPVTIPVVMLRQVDAEPLREALLRAETVRIGLADYSRAPIDGSFDNGVVAHEYGHGISNRLVGGPARNTCLLNNEQMGEGWSDFFLLASTPRSATPTPSGSERRSIGVYSTAAPIGSLGFRSQFYSTDPKVNTLTYDDVITAAVPHGVGEVWAATLWDIYWALVDRYGFDEDLVRGTGGNNRAVRLVIEAMKYTPCSPGLIDGRDALLMADTFQHGGEDACLLWDIFSRRGLGFSARQGESSLHNDNREAFDGNPACVPTVKLYKAASREYIKAGDSVTYTLTVRNDKPEAVTGLTLTDEVPRGMTVDQSSISGATDFTLDGNGLVLELPDLAAGERYTLSYRVLTDPHLAPTQLFGDGAEDGDEQWTTVSRSGSNGWTRTATAAFSGDTAWYVRNTDVEQEHSLQTAQAVVVAGAAPALRFFTRYETEPAYDGGVVEISTDGGVSWQGLADKFIRHAYRGRLSARGATPLRGQQSFWGDSEGYREVIVDLSAYRGRSVHFRWRFASDAAVGAAGWWLDHVEVVPELITYDGMARLTTSRGDRDSSRVTAPGVVVNFLDDKLVGVFPQPTVNPTVMLLPNPATGQVTLRFVAGTVGPGRIEIATATGKMVLAKPAALTGRLQEIPLDVSHLPTGTYTLLLTEAQSRTALRLSVIR
ncbi:M36 family metallopeptidase [Lewinella sp. IMCC34191]|uniref:M36 family metallopeptidase n=1 Tax=Lewinella sp. IMCC34191 TaxID=2259172 RepID=UPI000E24B678|nr:M36 family metallopeptidase [Lewinella sp. IMCC34191]